METWRRGEFLGSQASDQPLMPRAIPGGSAAGPQSAVAAALAAWREGRAFECSFCWITLKGGQEDQGNSGLDPPFCQRLWIPPFCQHLVILPFCQRLWIIPFCGFYQIASVVKCQNLLTSLHSAELPASLDSIKLQAVFGFF